MNYMIYCEVLRERISAKPRQESLENFCVTSFSIICVSLLSDDRRKIINDKPPVVDSSDAKQHKKNKREELFKNVNSSNQIV